jgi:hypothetical protein
MGWGLVVEECKSKCQSVILNNLPLTSLDAWKGADLQPGFDDDLATCMLVSLYTWIVRKSIDLIKTMFEELN